MSYLSVDQLLQQYVLSNQANKPPLTEGFHADIAHYDENDMFWYPFYKYLAYGGLRKYCRYIDEVDVICLLKSTEGISNLNYVSNDVYYYYLPVYLQMLLLEYDIDGTISASFVHNVWLNLKKNKNHAIHWLTFEQRETFAVWLQELVAKGWNNDDKSETDVSFICKPEALLRLYYGSYLGYRNLIKATKNLLKCLDASSFISLVINGCYNSFLLRPRQVYKDAIGKKIKHTLNPENKGRLKSELNTLDSNQLQTLIKFMEFSYNVLF